MVTASLKSEESLEAGVPDGDGRPPMSLDEYVAVAAMSGQVTTRRLGGGAQPRRTCPVPRIGSYSHGDTEFLGRLVGLEQGCGMDFWIPAFAGMTVGGVCGRLERVRTRILDSSLRSE